MLYRSWSEVIPELLAHLSPDEAKALQLESGTTTKIGIKTVRRFGFETVNDYSSALESAKRKSKEFLADKAIWSSEDLEFDRPKHSSDFFVTRTAI